MTVPADEEIWSRVRQSFMARGESVAGRGVAKAGAATRPSGAVQLPKSPPNWINEQIDAEGAGRVKDNRLKSARAAEADASEKLRQKLESLPLTPNMSLGQAAKQDARIAAAITRSLSKVQRATPQYLPDGTAKIRLTLDLRDAWQEIEEQN